MATTLRRWDPFRHLMSIQDELSRLFGRTYTGTDSMLTPNPGWLPPMDMYETEGSFVVTVELPGIDPDTVELSIENSILSITGHRDFYSEVNDEQFHRVERRFGSFSRAIALPAKSDPEKVEASFDKGVLTVEIPKSEQAKPRRITIKAGA